MPDQSSNQPAIRIPRATREESVRHASWSPPSLLPDPDPRPGWEFSWVAVTAAGQVNTVHANYRLREGFIPVLKSEVPEIVARISNVEKYEAFPDAVVVGGLMLCRMPEEMAVQRREYYRSLATAQLASVPSAEMPRQEHAGMPIINERTSHVSVGGKLI